MSRLEFTMPSICEACIHLTVLAEDADLNQFDPPEGVVPQSMSCASFPAGIPGVIYTDGGDHDAPIGGEVEREGKPILFEMEPGMEVVLENRRIMKETIKEVEQYVARRIGLADGNKG